MKKILILSILMVVAVSFALSAGGNSTISSGKGAFNTSESVTSTYANSEVDTVYWTRDPYCQRATFAAYYADSVSVTKATVRRIFNGTWQALQAGDTLQSFTGYEVIGAGAANCVSAILGLDGGNTLGQGAALPGSANGLADQYAIIITYVSTKNGVTAPNVKYIIEKVYGH